MEDWQELLQSILIGVIFSFLMAKLISMVISFRDENLRITRTDERFSDSFEIDTERKLLSDEEISKPEPDINLPIEPHKTVVQSSSDELNHSNSDISDIHASDNCKNDEKNSLKEQSLFYDEDDDWEGVESTELDERFSAATAFVAASAADRLSQKVSNDVQLELYGLYKIATEGPCSAPQPSAIKIFARAKWNAWKKLGAMPPEEAMGKYIMIVDELYPSWTSGLLKRNNDDHNTSNFTDKGPAGPVFSTHIHDDEPDYEMKVNTLQTFAREGEIENLTKCLETGVSVDSQDNEGLTALHWAVDRGHLNVVELLINRNANVNSKDSEGQTPLHYAVVCEREGIAEFLIKHNADRDAKDNDGNSPSDLCKSWPCLISGN